MQLTDIQRDREKVPLMKDLHELGLKHGVEFVVVYKPTGERGPLKMMLIDHKDDTLMSDVALHAGVAGMFLIQVAGAAAEVATDEPAPAKAP